MTKIGETVSSSLELNQPQLEAARALAWKQAEAAPAGSLPDGTEKSHALLTLEAAREWINEFGLVLFAPRAQQLPTPAPSLVEATLGTAKASPTPEESEVARGLVARMASEGLAVPLNLMGVTGETPDFIVSARVFSYIFTLRGDKAWKQPPSTSGAVKVSPLGLRVFEALTRVGAMTAAELAQELGREVTESAVVRALVELWSQLRVIPQAAQGPEARGDGATLWELTTRRFTKAIKAGANSGQPSALSALVSLYLTQVLAATEEEIVTFLSPLTARSRVREVLHALVAARELDTVVIDGRTLLHLPGGLPEVTVASAPVPEVVEGETAAASATAAHPGNRLKRMGTERRPGGGRAGAGQSWGQRGRGGDAGRSAGGRGGRPARPYEAKPEGRRKEGRDEAARRPFQKTPPFKRDEPERPMPSGEGAAGGAEPKSFARPWDEERRERSERRDQRPQRDTGSGERKPAWKREAGRGTEPSAGRSSGKRPSSGRGDGKRTYSAKGSGSGERAAFKPRRFEGAARGKAPFAGEGKGRSRSKPEWAPRERSPRGGDDAERRYAPRGGKPRGERGSGEFVEGAGSRPAGKFGGKPGGKFQGKPTGKFEGRPAGKFGKPAGKFGGKPSGKFEGRPAGKFGAKPAGKFGGKPAGRFSGKPAGKFGAKPGGKPKSGKFAKPAGWEARRSGSPGAAGRRAPKTGDQEQ